MVDLAGVARLLEPSFPALASAVCAGCLDEVLSNVGLDSLDMYSLFVQLNELADGSLDEALLFAGLRTVRDVFELISTWSGEHP